MKHWLQASLFTLLLIAFTGCATIMQGSSQEVSFSSSPSSASVSVNGNDLGTTPIVADLDRDKTHRVEINLDGYQPYETSLTRSLSGWVAGNIIFGGIPGLAVDAITGGMYKLSPEQIDTSLNANQASADEAEDGSIYITVVLEPDPEWEQVGQLTPEGE